MLPETKGRSLEDMSLYFAEITGDRSVLEAEAQIQRGQHEGGVEMSSTAVSPSDTPNGLEDSEII